MAESRQSDDQEGRLFTRTRESETVGFCLVHRAFNVRSIRWLWYNQLFLPNAVHPQEQNTQALSSLKGEVYMRLFHI